MTVAINLASKFASFEAQWTPKIIGEVNDCDVKVAKLNGAFVWHHHDEADELFLVVRGRMTMRFRDRSVEVGEGELIIVPRGVEHLPVAEDEVHVLLFEPKGTLNTGSARGERTVEDPERL